MSEDQQRMVNPIVQSNDAKSNGNLKTLDLFAGVGGISLGMEWAGHTSVVSADVEPAAVTTFRANFPAAEGLVADLESDSDFAAVLEAAEAQRVDAVVGGPPCQGFSQVGNHRDLENDPRNRLYLRFIKAVRRLKPRVFLMENVPGLAQKSGGQVLRTIEKSLTLDGAYSVVSGVLDAADFGVPQSRRRLFFVGVRSDLGIAPSLPSPPGNLLQRVNLERLQEGDGVRYELRYDSTGQQDLWAKDNDVLKALLDPEDLRFVTVEQAISDLEALRPSAKLRQQKGDNRGAYPSPPLSAFQRLMREQTNGEFHNSQVPFMWPDTQQRLGSIPQGGNFRDLPEELTQRYLNGQKWGPETGKAELSRKYFFAYRRLHPQFVSWTLNTKADCVYHYDGTRALSVREFARLSSFPDHFAIEGSDKHTRYRLVGNAVPPLLARALGLHIAALLTGG